MANMYNLIAELCAEKGVNVTQMSRETGIPRSVFSELKAGRTKQLSNKYLPTLADYFGVSVDYLLGNEEKLPAAECDEELAEMLEDIRRNPELRAMFDLAKGSTAEEVRTYTNVIRALKEGNGHG